MLFVSRGIYQKVVPLQSEEQYRVVLVFGFGFFFLNKLMISVLYIVSMYVGYEFSALRPLQACLGIWTAATAFFEPCSGYYIHPGVGSHTASM